MAFPPKKTPPKTAPKKGVAPAPAPGTPEEEEPKPDAPEGKAPPEEGVPKEAKSAPVVPKAKGAPAAGGPPPTNQTVPQNGQKAEAAPEFPGVKQPALGKAPNAAPPSAASMNQAQANAQIPMLAQLMDIVEGLAQLVVGVQSAIPGITAPVGQAAPSNGTQPATGVANPTPSNPTQLPPGKPQPMQAVVTPPGQPAPDAPKDPNAPDAPKDGQPAAPAAPAPHRISTPELATVIALVDLAMQGRLPRAGAAVLMSSAFGFDEKSAKALVTPDGGTQSTQAGVGDPLPQDAVDVDEEGNPVDEDGEAVEEEGVELDEDNGEPEGVLAKEGDLEETPAPKWGKEKIDGVDVLKALESERDALKIRLDALLEVRDALETD